MLVLDKKLRLCHLITTLTQKLEWGEDDRFNITYKILHLTKWKPEGSQGINT